MFPGYGMDIIGRLITCLSLLGGKSFKEIVVLWANNGFLSDSYEETRVSMIQNMFLNKTSHIAYLLCNFEKTISHLVS